MATAAAAKLPCPSMAVCGVKGSIHVVWLGKPAMRLRLWPLSAQRLSFTRYVGMLACLLPYCCPWREVCHALPQTTEADSVLVLE